MATRQEHGWTGIGRRCRIVAAIDGSEAAMFCLNPVRRASSEVLRGFSDGSGESETAIPAARVFRGGSYEILGISEGVRLSQDNETWQEAAGSEERYSKVQSTPLDPGYRVGRQIL